MAIARTTSLGCVTGASSGFGRALAHALVHEGWNLVVDARRGVELRPEDRDRVTALRGDVTDPDHRASLAEAVGEHLDLLVLNAGTLGPSPLPYLERLTAAELRDTVETNLVAQLGLVQAFLPALRRAHGVVVGLSSDAAREPYPGWGAYGASKAALDQLLNVLGAEEPALRVYAFDPGDLRTPMHQAAFPDEDISDRPLPETAVPPLFRLLRERPESGRYRAADLGAEVAG